MRGFAWGRRGLAEMFIARKHLTGQGVCCRRRKGAKAQTQTIAAWRARTLGNKFGSCRAFALGRKAQTADKEKHHACNEEG